MAINAEEISDADFAAFSSLAYQLAGIALTESKRQLLMSRLIRRVRALKLQDIASYRDYLDANLDVETDNFVNAITTNLTSFFREKYHFDYLQQWLDEHPQSSYRMWSAACSTGQEPYSMAMCLQQCGALSKTQIYATDIDTQVVDTAKAGVYRDAELEDFEPRDLQKFFQRGVGNNAGFARIKGDLKKNITFDSLNLMDRWPDAEKFDVIFCRNVFIYFDAETQNKILQRFAERLKPQGVLFLGHSESIRTTAEWFVQDGRTTYLRTDKPSLPMTGVGG